MKLLTIGCSTLLMLAMLSLAGLAQPVHIWTSAEVAAPDSIEGQLRSEGLCWTQSPQSEIGVGTYVQDILEGRLDQPVGRGAIGKVVSVSTAQDGKPLATVDFGRGYSVPIYFSELCPVVISPTPTVRPRLRARIGVAGPQVTAARSFDIDFGIGKEALSTQTGRAAAGSAGDFWNTVMVPWSDDHTESGLKFTDGGPSPIQVRMINLGGGWSSDGRMGVKSPMLDHYNYPKNNRGGNSSVILRQVPTGRYDLYIYGHGPDPRYYGDYTLTVGQRDYGRKTTCTGDDLVRQTEWVEGGQYVRFSGIMVAPGEDVTILIQPGKEVTDHWGRTFADAIICGLQLMPAR